MKRKGSDYHALAPQTGLEPVTHVGQKHSRLTSLGALVILLVFSCSSRPFFCHRQRGTMNQLTAATRLPKHGFNGSRHIYRLSKRTTRLGGSLAWRPKQDSNL